MRHDLEDVTIFRSEISVRIRVRRLRFRVKIEIKSKLSSLFTFVVIKNVQKSKSIISIVGLMT